MERSTEERVMAGLAHIGYLAAAVLPIPFLGLVTAGVIYMAYRSKSSFVSSHAKQAFGFQAVVSIMAILLVSLSSTGIIGLGFGIVMGNDAAARTALGAVTIGGLLLALLGLTATILTLWGAIMAFMGERYRYPMVGGLFSRVDS